MTNPIITEDQVKEALLAYIDDPRRNPGGGCEYTTVFDEHCIAGRVVIDLGGKLPDRHATLDTDGIWNQPLNTLAFRRLAAEFDTGLNFTPEAVALLDAAQMLADGASGESWNIVVQSVIERHFTGGWE